MEKELETMQHNGKLAKTRGNPGQRGAQAGIGIKFI
jgi:hypothetical protein